jgi:ABC-type branched-subunit amino acid transport system substrate-binding protein
LKCPRLVVITDESDPVAAAFAAAFLRVWRDLSREDKDAATEEWTLTPNDDRAKLPARFKAAKPDCVLLAVGPSEFRRLRRLSFGDGRTLLYGGDDDDTAEFAEDHEGPAAYRVTSFAAGADLGPNGKAFVDAYRERFHEPPDPTAALAYEGVTVVLDALERAKSAQPSRLVHELSGVEVSGVTGPVTPGIRGAKRRLFVVRDAGGETKVVATFSPGGE